MNLLLFDVDGVLLDTSADDERLFREALRESLPADARDVAVGAWHEFAEVTQPAIAREVISRACNRPARDAELMIVRRALTKKWQQALDNGSATIRLLPGAREIIDAARKRPHFAAAIATGGWAPTTLMKLTAAGFPVDDLVVATGDDSETRLGIVNTAAMVAAAGRGVPGFSATVLVSAGPWDTRTAQSARAGLVGVAREKEHAFALRGGGAAAIVPSFQPPEPFWAAVAAALAHRHGATTN